MSLIVQKFGGTSVATSERILAAARRAVDAKRAGHQVVMVVSARGKKTDELVDLAAQITDAPRAREMDMLLSTGEQESVALVAMAIHTLGEQAVSMTGGQIGIITDSTFSKARIRSISTETIQRHLDAGRIVVACGFQGVDDEQNITTLGRGGSDTTATALAAALRAKECEIYTDVEGVFSTDPRAVPEARKIQQISYDEMLELASVGAGVMHSRSIEFAKKFNVPLRVRPSYADGVGTLIAAAGDSDSRVVTGLALVKNEARVTMLDLPDRPGVMSTIFTRMAAHKIPIDMVVQNVASQGKAEVSFTVPASDLAETLTAGEEAIRELGAGQIQSGTHVAKVSAVGNGMRSHSGVAAQMFQTIANQGANIEMITTSEIKISALVDRSGADGLLQHLHQDFQLEAPRPTAPAVGVKQTGPATWDAAAHDALLREVVGRLGSMEDIVVSEVLLDDTQSRVTIHNLPDIPGTCAQLFTAVAEGDVMVDMIVQNVSHAGAAEISFTVPKADLDRCLLLVREVLSAWEGAQLSSERDIAKLTVVGIGLRTHTGVGEKMFRALAEADINIQMINTSEIRMSAVVQLDQGANGLTALEQAFGLGSH
ncbi:MAG: aspartate kinase [Planctomycetaceae bacterium]|nr:aspartate kinase [Planctomycetaceae bacterium]